MASSLLAALAASLCTSLAPRPPPAPPAAPPQSTQATDPTPAQCDEALETFANSLADVQAATLADLAATLEALPAGPLRKQRERAAKGLTVVAAIGPPPFFSPQEFTPGEATRGRVVRAPVTPESEDAAAQRGRFRPWENDPPFFGVVEWDWAGDRVVRRQEAPIDGYGQLWNALNGYDRDSDLLVASLLARFDFEEKLDAKADYFAHSYCDLSGHVYPEITLHDAWSSGTGMDMPDVDTIAWARRLMNDKSYVAPLPADGRRQKLYDSLSAGFLEWFRYWVWIEGAAQIWVNPDAPLRDAHEPMRRRLLHLFATCDGDVDKIAKRLKALATRDQFIEAMDAEIAADARADAAIAKFVAKRSEERWAVARAAYAVLRRHGLLDG